MSRALIVATSILVCAPGVARAQARRAYVQRTTSTQTTLAWRDATPATDGACVGASVSSLTRFVGTRTSIADHAIVVDGLTPRSRYFYRAGVSSCPPSSAGDPLDTFVTAPTPGSTEPIRFWVVGDSGTGGAEQRAVRDAALRATGARPFDLFVHVGDMAYNSGTTSEFTNNFFGIYAEVLRSVPVFPAIGNHEGTTSDSATQTGPYYEAYTVPTDGRAGGLASGTEAYYSYDWGNIHFIVLDSHESPRAVDGAMLRWVQADLAATSATWRIAFWHHPPYSDTSHNSDTETQLIQMRENALPILESAGVDLVLTGHSHGYERSYLLHGAYDTPSTTRGIADMGDGQSDGDGAYESGPSGAVYVVAGHGGAGIDTGDSASHPLMYMSELVHGSCIVEVSGNTLTLRNIRRDGVESDHLTLEKGLGLRFVAPTADASFAPASTVGVRWVRGMASFPFVRLEASYDGGAFETLAARTENDGVFDWPAPDREARVQLRLTDADAPGRFTTSAAFVLSRSRREVTIPFGSTWEYSDHEAAPAADWQTGAGGTWPSGPAQLGYGDGDEATVLYDASPNVPSVYFRRRIDTGTANVTGATLRGLYDDAIAVWVNGRLVHERNTAAGLTHEVFAGASDGENAMFSTAITADAFRAGSNWIAAIVKQSDGSSSDVSFDLELTLDLRTPTPPGVDAGIDAGFDAGPTDAAGADARASAEDAGGSAGNDARAMNPDAGEDSGGGGCGCRVGGASGSAPWRWCGVSLALLLALRRRRAAAV